MSNLNSIVLLIIVVIDCSLFSFVDRKLVESNRSSRIVIKWHFKFLVRAPRSLTCSKIVLKNGYVRYVRRKPTTRLFSCNGGFELHGKNVMKCVSGRWKGDVPICISKFSSAFFNCENKFCAFVRLVEILCVSHF